MMILITLFIILILIFVILTLFSFPQFSPIPYFPTNKKDLPLIIKSLYLKNEQIFFDLGAGDGVVIFEAAKKAFEKKLNTQFIAVEINPVLILILSLRRLFHPNKNNIKILWADMFRMNFKCYMLHVSCSVFYLYISPWLLEKTVKKIKELKRKITIVSYMYPITSLHHQETSLKGIHSIYIYQ